MEETGILNIFLTDSEKDRKEAFNKAFAKLINTCEEESTKQVKSVHKNAKI